MLKKGGIGLGFGLGIGSGAPPVVDVTAPTITSSSSLSLLEGYALSHTLTADEAVTWTKTGGADTALFSLAGSTLSLTARDFDIPTDADTNNSYVVQVTATDGAANATNQTITVTVSDLSAETEALLARFTTPATSARATLINTLYASLKTGAISGSNLLAKMDMFYIIAAETEQAGQRNWIADANNLVPTSSPTFVADRGYAGNGTSSYVTWGGALVNTGGLFTQNSANLWAWETLDVDAGSSLSVGTTGTNSSQFLSGRSSGNAITRMNDITNLSAAVGTSMGLLAGNRSASNAKVLYKNGVGITSSGTNSSGTGLADTLSFLRNGSNFSARRIGAGGKGSSLTANEHLDLYNALQAYMTGVGA